MMIWIMTPGFSDPISINVKGRELRGVVDKANYEKFRDAVQGKLEAIPDNLGRPMKTQVFKPEHVYSKVRNVAPDLIVQFRGLSWRSICGVGHSKLYLQDNDTDPDGCNHSKHGAFILSAP